LDVLSFHVCKQVNRHVVVSKQVESANELMMVLVLVLVLVPEGF
jgi:hypothetical protein